MSIGLEQNTRKDIIDKALTIGSIGDAGHDFGFSSFTTATDIIPGLPKTSYTPKNYSEVDVLRSVFKLKDDQTAMEDKFTIPNEMDLPPAGGAVKITDSIKTINDHNYNITRINVKKEDRDRITAEDFFSMGNFYSGGGETNIALIIDCVSIKFIEMIKNGGRANLSGLKCFLLKAPELENDPGGKKNINDKIFNDNGVDGVYLKPAVPFNFNEDGSYTYNYDSTSNDSLYGGFFTKYNFTLSELILERKFIFERLSSTLTISNNDPELKLPTIIVPDSGNKNEINALTKLIANFKSLFSSRQANQYETEFNVNASYQQKRTGDWLQALLAALVANGDRQFVEHKDAGKDPLKFLPNDVYLVTHDRILLAFALLLGINVIFTHKKPEQDGQPSVHSALVYRINNPEAVAAQQEELVSKFNTNVFLETLAELKQKIDEAKQRIDMTDLKMREAEAIENAINAIRAAIGTAAPIDLNIINKSTQFIFTSAFLLNLLEIETPTNLDNLKGEIEGFIATYNSAVTGELTIADIGIITQNNSAYNILENKIKQTLAGLEGISSGTIQASVEQNIKKSKIYKLIKEWNWQSSTKYVIDPTKDYNVELDVARKKNEKNIFLSNLGRLPRTIAEKINDIYYAVYAYIIGETFISLASDKLNVIFKDRMASFCIEVLININARPDNTLTIKDYISRFSPIITQAVSVQNDRMAYENEFNIISLIEEDININARSEDVIVGGGFFSEIAKSYNGYNYNYNDYQTNVNLLMATVLFATDDFHPLLPIYLIMGSFYRQIDLKLNLKSEDGWLDYDLYSKFYLIMQRIYDYYNRESMIFLSYGPGLRELLFTSHQYSDRTAREKELLNLDDKDYNYFSMMCSLFSNGVCGSVNTDPAIGFQHIMDLPSLDLEDIMTADYDNEDDKEELIENTKTLYNLIGLRIIADERAKHVLIESQLSIPTSIPASIPMSIPMSIPKSMSTSMKTKLKKNKSKHKKKKNTLSTVYEEEENPDSDYFLPPSKQGKTSTAVPTQRYTKKRGTTNRLLRQRLIEAIRNSRAQALQASTRKFNEEDEDSDTATVATAANSRKRSSTTNYETAKNISRNNNLSKKKRSSQMVTTGGRNKRGTKKYMKRKHKKTRNNKIKNKKYSTIKKIKRKNKKTRKNRHY